MCLEFGLAGGADAAASTPQTLCRLGSILGVSSRSLSLPWFIPMFTWYKTRRDQDKTDWLELLMNLTGHVGSELGGILSPRFDLPSRPMLARGKLETFIDGKFTLIPERGRPGLGNNWRV